MTVAVVEEVVVTVVAMKEMSNLKSLSRQLRHDYQSGRITFLYLPVTFSCISKLYK